MQWWTAQFKVVLQSTIGELTLLPNLQDIFHSYVSPPSFMKDDKHVLYSKRFRPDTICCNGNSYGTLANKSSIEIPKPVIEIYFGCYVSAPKNSLRNAPLSLTGFFAPHFTFLRKLEGPWPLQKFITNKKVRSYKCKIKQNKTGKKKTLWY